MSNRNFYKFIFLGLFGLTLAGIVKPTLAQKDKNINFVEQQKSGKVVKVKDEEESAEEIRIVGEFHEGLAKFERDGKYGYVDEKGNIAVAAKYDEAGNFSEQLAAVVVDRKSFFIDGAGRVVIALDDYDAYSNYRGRHMAFGGNLPFIDYMYTLSEFKKRCSGN